MGVLYLYQFLLLANTKDNMSHRMLLMIISVITLASMSLVILPSAYASGIVLANGDGLAFDSLVSSKSGGNTAAFASANATLGTGLNPDPVSVSLLVSRNELLVAGLTYSTAGSVSPNNGIASITDTEGLAWTHVLNSGITGGDEGVDTYYALATSAHIDVLTIAPQSTTYKSGFVSSWSASALDLTHAVSTCDPSFANSITTTVTTSGRATIGLFSAANGHISSGTGPGTFHFDFYNTGPNGVTVNVDDGAVSSSGTYTDTWSWTGSSTACSIAVPIS